MTMTPPPRPTVLIVEDNDINRELLHEYLCDRYNVLLASNGTEGMDIIEQNLHKISLVLLDIVMPGLSGLEMLEEMNENGWIEFVPVVIISAEGSEEFKHRAYLNNVYNFISKPFTYNEVIACVNRIIYE